MTLQEEAEKYAKEEWGYKNKPVIKESVDKVHIKNSCSDFIAGATSKYVEKQKLEFAIKELMQVNILIPFEHQYAKDCIENKIKELEQKLNEL